MKTSKIIFISLLSFIGIVLLSFMIIGIVFKDEGDAMRHVSRSYPVKTIMIDKPFKHIIIKNDMFYEVKKQKEFSAKDDKKENSSFGGDSKNSVAEDLSSWDETSLQNTGNSKLPEFFYGEWYRKGGTREYNGMLIRPDFMEHFYQACTYDKIEKKDDSYIITVKCDNGTTATYKIQQITKDRILVEYPGGNPIVMDRVDCPLNGIRINPEKLPKQLRQRWYTTDGNNKIEFDLTGDELIFKGTKYRIIDVVLFREKWGKQYRIIAKNSAGKAMMFYFKKWSDKYCQVGYYGKNGDIYKNNPGYPNRRSLQNRIITNSDVSISQGKVRKLGYYNINKNDSLNHPVIEVKNDTLYLITNDNLMINLISADSLLSIGGNDCKIKVFMHKLPLSNISLENSELLIHNNAIDMPNFDTIRLNINNSKIYKMYGGGRAGYIEGTIKNGSDVTLPQAKRIQLDVDETSTVRFW